MHKATKHADRPHTRIYQHWLSLPTWKAMRGEAQLLLLHMLTEFRPAMNSRLEWPLTRVQRVLHCSRSTASQSLTDLEKNGWITISDRCVAWVESEIDAWIADRIASRRSV
jgi:hypothetical protein